MAQTRGRKGKGSSKSRSPARRKRSKTPVRRERVKTPKTKTKTSPKRAAATTAAAPAEPPFSGLVVEVDASRLFFFLACYYGVVAINCLANSPAYFRAHGLDFASLATEDVPASDIAGWTASLGLHVFATMLLCLTLSSADESTQGIAGWCCSVAMLIGGVTQLLKVPEDLEAIGAVGSGMEYVHGGILAVVLVCLALVRSPSSSETHPTTAAWSAARWSLGWVLALNILLLPVAFSDMLQGMMLHDWGYSAAEDANPAGAIVFLKGSIRGASLQMTLNAALLIAIMLGQKPDVLLRASRDMWAWCMMAAAFWCSAKIFTQEGHANRGFAQYTAIGAFSVGAAMNGYAMMHER